MYAWEEPEKLYDAATGAIKTEAKKRQKTSPYLHEPHLNRGTGFSTSERQALQLDGLLPSVVESIDHQCKRWTATLVAEPDMLKKYEILNQLQATDSHLYYKVLVENLVALMPVVYTPTVGAACMNFDRIYRNSFGLHLSFFEHRGRLRSV